jgi:hypothetical protein
MILSVQTTAMHCTTFPAIVWNCADENGCIRWSAACQAAKDHGLWEDFRTDYGVTAKFGPVDAGEFLVWLGY